MGKRKNKNSLVLSEIEGQLPEELTYQRKFRQAIAGAVSESDISEVVKGIVTRAKSGDANAVGQLFKHVLATNQPIKITQNNYYEGEDQKDPLPGDPKSNERIEAMRGRVSRGEAIFGSAASNGHE